MSGKIGDSVVFRMQRWILLSSQDRAWQAAFVAVVLASAFFFWQSRIGFDMSDEGFLWYGTERVLNGEVPLRDFFSYDPGRYYWSSLFLWLFQDHGIVALRAASSLIQATGLFLGLRALQGALQKNEFGFVVVAALTILVWMFPRHKYFDITAALSLIAVLTWLCDGPTLRRYFFAGVVVGVAAIFGRNHGVYGAAGSLFVLCYLRLSNTGPAFFRSGFALAGGVLLGYAPLLLFVLMDQGFAHAMWQSVLFQFGAHISTLPVPVPWPWRVSFGKHTIFGLAYLAVFLWGAVGMIAMVWCHFRNVRIPALIVSCAALALPYAHALSLRADTAHLAQAIYPALLALICWISLQSQMIKWSLMSVLCVSSVVIMLHEQPGWACRPNKNCPQVQVGSDQLSLEPRVARDFTFLQGLINQYAPAPQTFLALPSWSGLYAATNRKAPMWDTFALQARDDIFQRHEIERIIRADPKFAVIWDAALDGDDSLRYSNTHRVMADYIRKNFVRIPSSPPNPDFQIYLAPSVRK